MKTDLLQIATDFSPTPGPRSPLEGDCSGEEFLEKVLEPRFKRAVENGAKLVINLDGAEGYATSFLEASFGGLARKYDIALVLSTIEIVSEDEPLLKEEIVSYIKEARNQ